MPVDVRSLRCFLAVAASGSISRAAEVLCLAQPALSLQIQRLEEALGVALFTRSHKGVVPTAAGMRFEKHAQEILTRLDFACNDVRDLVTDPEGRVALGLPQSMAKILTVPLVRETIRRWPKVRLQIVELSSGYIPSHLLSGHINIGLTFQSSAGSGLLFDHIVDEELVLVAAPGNLSAGCKNDIASTPLAHDVLFRDLHRYPMLLPAVEHGLRGLIDGYLRTHKVELVVLAEVNAIPELIALVSAGVGSTILSYASVHAEVRNGCLSVARISHPTMSRPVYLCRPATLPLSIAASAILDLIREVVGKQIADGNWPVSAGMLGR
ncbi:LysR family transcriptional regulator [Burkholderia pseudomallei]|nr:LysR substrate-binding domain-containing protein [Burkholderia pseudomallei]ARK95733.1 LysR family transcriptional regulator [Burkholderia pseudomallei]